MDDAMPPNTTEPVILGAMNEYEQNIEFLIHALGAMNEHEQNIEFLIHAQQRVRKNRRQ